MTVEAPPGQRPACRGAGNCATSPHSPAADNATPCYPLRSPADPSWIDPTTRPGRLRLRGHHGPDSLWSHHLLARHPIGPPLGFTHLSDDHGTRLRFTGAMAAIHAVDLVDGSLTADFTDFRITRTPA
ncbi:hypothetical protein ACIRBZ_17855 [Streptomyces sp. NPDC094038]|uniref:hypothetical protein n=1 Tax=Streptomyces sp. NPDC094038 TaxID=3366055 RepID=UPI0038013647